jgi:hypothetical protein
LLAASKPCRDAINGDQRQFESTRGAGLGADITCADRV